MALGIMPNMKYNEEIYTFGEGDRFFVYTDGLPEATNGDDERLMEPAMFEIIKNHRDDDNKTLLQDIRKDVDDFVNGAPQFDDLTMMVIEYKG